MEHLQAYKNKAKDSVLWKHVANEHGGDTSVEFQMKVLKTYGRDNEARKANEGVRINYNKGVKLNSKAEYRQSSFPRLVIYRNMNE